MQLSRAQLRLPLTALLGGGLLLVLLGQIGYTAVPPALRGRLLPIIALGALAFLWGSHMADQARVPGPVYRLVYRLARWLGVAPGQIALLLLAPAFAALATLTAGKQLIAYHAGVAAAAWLLALLCAALGSLAPYEAAPRVSRRVLWGTAVLFGVALLLRGAATDQIPTTFSGDEGAAGLFARMFLTGETDNLLTFGWFSFPSFYFALQSLGIWIFGQTIPALRLGSALAGALSVVAVFWLGRVLFGRLHAWLAALLLTFAHYHIHMSRIALNNVWDGLFAALALAGLWDGWRNGRRLSFVVCGLALGLGQYFYVSMRVLPVLFAIWALTALLTERERLRVRLPGLLLAAFVAAVIFLPLGVLYVQHPDDFNAPLNRVTIVGERLDALAAQRGQTPAQVLLDQLVKGFLAYTHEPLRLLYDPGVPLLLPIAAALFLLGALLSLWNFDLRYWLIWLPLLAVPILGAFSQNAPASQRYVLTIPAVMLLLALPLAQFAAWLRQLWPRRAPLAVGLALLVVAWIAVTDVRYYFFEAYRGYVLGGVNTETATEVAYYLRAQQPASQKVYFFGWPRMGYYSHATIPYLAPAMRGEDVATPLTQPPDWSLAGPTQFIFLPERLGELAQVQAVFPDGSYWAGYSRRGDLLFGAYAVNPPRAP